MTQFTLVKNDGIGYTVVAILEDEGMSCWTFDTRYEAVSKLKKLMELL